MTHQHQFFVFFFDDDSVEKSGSGMSDVFRGGKVITPAAHALVTPSAKSQAGNGYALETTK